MAENTNWLTLNPTAGTSGLTNVTMTSNACPTRTSRKAVITFKAGDNLTRQVTVVQNGSVVDYGDRLKAKKIGNITSVSATQIMINFGVASPTNPEGATYYYKVSTNATEEYAANSGWKSIHATATSITETISLSVGSEAYVHSAAIKETSSNVEHKMFTHSLKYETPVVTCVENDKGNHYLKFTWTDSNANAGYYVYSGTTPSFTIVDRDWNDATSPGNRIRSGGSHKNITLSGLQRNTTYYIKVVAFNGSNGYANSDPGLGSGKTSNTPEVVITGPEYINAISEGTITFTKYGDFTSNMEVRPTITMDSDCYSIVTEGVSVANGVVTGLFTDNTKTNDSFTIRNTNGLNTEYSMVVSAKIYQNGSEIYPENVNQKTIIFKGNEHGIQTPTLSVQFQTQNGEWTTAADGYTFASENGAQTSIQLRVKAFAGDYGECNFDAEGINNAQLAVGELTAVGVVADNTYHEVTLRIYQNIYTNTQSGTFKVICSGDGYNTITYTYTVVKSGANVSFSVTPTEIYFVGTDTFLGSGATSQDVTVNSNTTWTISKNGGGSWPDWISLVYDNAVHNTGPEGSFSGSKTIKIVASKNPMTSDREVNLLFKPSNGTGVIVHVKQGPNWYYNGQETAYIGINIVDSDYADVDTDSPLGRRDINVLAIGDQEHVYTKYTVQVFSNVRYKLVITDDNNGNNLFVHFGDDSSHTLSDTGVYEKPYIEFSVYVNNLYDDDVKRINVIKAMFNTGNTDSHGAYIFTEPSPSSYSPDSPRVGVLRLIQSTLQTETEPIILFKTLNGMDFPGYGADVETEVLGDDAFVANNITVGGNTTTSNTGVLQRVLIYSNSGTTLSIPKTLGSEEVGWSLCDSESKENYANQGEEMSENTQYYIFHMNSGVYGLAIKNRTQAVNAQISVNVPDTVLTRTITVNVTNSGGGGGEDSPIVNINSFAVRVSNADADCSITSEYDSSWGARAQLKATRLSGDKLYQLAVKVVISHNDNTSTLIASSETFRGNGDVTVTAINENISDDTDFGTANVYKIYYYLGTANTTYSFAMPNSDGFYEIHENVLGNRYSSWCSSECSSDGCGSDEDVPGYPQIFDVNSLSDGQWREVNTTNIVGHETISYPISLLTLHRYSKCQA